MIEYIVRFFMEEYEVVIEDKKSGDSKRIYINIENDDMIVAEVEEKDPSLTK
jgi:hypothetical protein